MRGGESGFADANKEERWPRMFRIVRQMAHCFSAYSDWYKVFHTFYGGRRVSLTIRDTDLKIHVDRSTLASAIKLAACLSRLRYLQQGKALVLLAPGGYAEVLDPAEIISNRATLRWLCWLSDAARSGCLITSKGGTITVMADGLRWIVRRGSEDLRLGPLLGHTFEKHEHTEWFSKMVGSGTVFVDVGANVGGYTLRAARLGAKVYALEPSLGNYSILKQNATTNQLRPVMYRLAAYSKNGEAILYGRVGGEGKFGLKRLEDAEITEAVHTVTLDSLLADRVDRVDLLKIDVEGLELEVLRGSKWLLEVTENVMLEVRETAAVDWLKKHGFKLRDVGSSFGNVQNMLFSKA